MRSSLPAAAPPQQNSLTEVVQLRAEVGRLQQCLATTQKEAQDLAAIEMKHANDLAAMEEERKTLRGSIEHLQKELRQALEENRRLTDGLEERKLLLDAQSAEREAAAREEALNSAKSLFRSMLENGNIENQRPINGREHARHLKATTCREHPKSLAELKGMTLKDLKTIAREVGLSHETSDCVDDQDDPKEAIIQLISQQASVQKRQQNYACPPSNTVAWSMKTDGRCRRGPPSVVDSDEVVRS